MFNIISIAPKSTQWILTNHFYHNLKVINSHTHWAVKQKWVNKSQECWVGKVVDEISLQLSGERRQRQWQSVDLSFSNHIYDLWLFLSVLRYRPRVWRSSRTSTEELKVVEEEGLIRWNTSCQLTAWQKSLPGAMLSSVSFCCTTRLPGEWNDKTQTKVYCAFWYGDWFQAFKKLDYEQKIAFTEWHEFNYC